MRKVVLSALGQSVDIIVINDGSTDGSVASLADISDITVLEHPVNKGKGAALDTGLQFALEQGYVACITIDADLQHPPELITQFLEKLSIADLVLGIRKRSGTAMPLQRRLSNFLTTYLLKLKTGVDFKDSQCGYRGYRLNSVKSVLPSLAGFMAETEILINAARAGLRPDFVEIPVIYGDTDSKMKPVESIIGFIRLMLFK